MKAIKYLLVVSLIVIMGSCQKDFLQLPISSTTTVDSVFSTTVNAETAIAQAYTEILNQGLPYQGNWNAMIDDNISGALLYGFSWSISYNIATSTGMSASSYGEDMDGFTNNYTAIRQAYLVKENIDEVKDMSASDKNIVKAEMQALIAYRYEQMFIMYGGVPIVTKSFNPNDNLSIPRAPLKEVLDSITSWCDQAAAVLPSQWSANWTGRMTKSAALAIKAKTLMYAARPLFNRATPYLDLGTHNDFICLGTADPTRWSTAAQASEAVISEAESNGGLHIINTGNPIDDYGTATSLPGSSEVILAYKNENWNMIEFLDPHIWEAYANGLTTNYLVNYYKADGTDQTWPNTTTVTPFSDYVTRMNQMEPRFKADYWATQIDAWNNPNDSHWSNLTLFQWGTSFCAYPAKFFYKAGSRQWIEFPIFRLAAYYLSAAEAYNEMGEAQQALNKLNIIHQRAGLPAITTTDQATLRTIIQREWAVEFFDENYRLHDVKHWMLPNIGNGIIGGPIRAFTFNDATNSLVTGNTNYQDKVIYQGFWSPSQYLNPFPQTEVNKGIIVQNPGY
jgi:hypothetical protein